MNLNKTDFIHYMHCPNSFWLLKRKPDQYPHGEFSEYAQKLVAEGYEVEGYVRQLVSTWDDADQFSFQRDFLTKTGLYARADLIRTNEDGSLNLYEIKSSTRVKSGGAHNQIKDACFQMLAAQASGERIKRIFIVHLNGKYVREGEIDPEQMLRFVDVTQKVLEIEDETKAEMSEALDMLALPEIDETSCSCLRVSKSNHCDTFQYFNPDIPKPSIYNLPRISKSKLTHFVDDGRFDLDDISLDEVTEKQSYVLRSAQLKEPVVDQRLLARWFSRAEYPLYFIDYETYASAVPIVDGARPHGAIPFQYSLHIKRTPDDMELLHVEYLADKAALPKELVDHMAQHIGPKGSVICWHASFENTQNKTMAAQFPDKLDFLRSLIDRTLDLEEIFGAAYVDIAFEGSTSIKKVLPVLGGGLDYKGMAVANGTDAMNAWQRLISMPDGAEKEQLRTDMLEYCKLDTYAMVRLFEAMENV